jgi:hypothetical protein
MKLVTLRSIYKNLLQEAILDQSTFLFKLSDIIENRSDLFIQEKSLLGNLLKDIEDTQLRSLQGSKNKKARKKAEIIIHKNLRKIKGISGDPINLKKMRPLYDSIIQFLTTKKDVNVEHCLLAADYYMNDFYDNADSAIKQEIDNGRIDFSVILKTTNFYQQYFDFKDTLGLFENSTIKIYSDEKIKVVYPQTPYAFNMFITSSGIPVDWCTQNPSTWQAYNKNQFVMIIQDLIGDKGIISLKVDFNGSIDYEGTCDQYNTHMNKHSVRSILPVEAEKAIKSAIEEEKINALLLQEFEPSDVDTYIKGLLDANNYEEINALLITVSMADTTGDMFYDAATNLVEYSKNKNKLIETLNIFIDSVASLNFDNQDFSVRMLSVWLKGNNVEKETGRLLVEKCLNKRSHVKNFILFCNLFDYDSFANEIDIDSEKIKQMSFVAFDKNNPINFKKIVSAISLVEDLSSLLVQKDYFFSAFSSKGFKNYFKEKKDKIIVLSSIDYSFHPMGNKSETFISKLISNNKEKFVNFVQEYNNEEEENIKIDSLDYSLIARYILHRSKFNEFEINNIGLENISDHTFDLQKEDLKEIADNIYTDLELVKFLCEKSNFLIDALLSHYLSIETPWVQESKRNSSIDFNNQESYQIFLYLLKNSNEKIPELIDENQTQPPFGISNHFKFIVSLINKFGSNEKNLDRDVKEILVNIASRNLFFKGLFHKNNFIDENLVDFYFEIISNVQIKKESLDIIKNYIVSSEFLNNNKEPTSLQKLISKIVTMPQVKNSIISDIQNSDDNINDIYNIFFLLDNVTLDSDVITSVCIKYLNIISGNVSNVDNNLRNSGRQINRKLVSSMALNKEITEIIGQLINKEDFWQKFYFKDFIFLLIKRCNEENIGFYKEHLAKIFYNRRFSNLSDNDRYEILNNFISKGSDGEDNYLNTRDRVIVKNCLKDCLSNGASLEKDYEYIMNLCESLDRYSKFQLRTAFPKEKRLEDKEVNESLIKNYIRLFFG